MNKSKQTNLEVLETAISYGSLWQQCTVLKEYAEGQ